MEVSKQIENLYGNRLRLRACGVCVEEDKLLLVRHTGLGTNGYLWAPPGGGVEYGSNVEENLIREFREETGLHIKIENFLFVYEYLHPPLHTVELFFEVSATGGTLMVGKDPEMSDSAQIIEGVRFVSFRELSNFASGSLHQMLRGISHKDDLLRKSGLFKFEKN